MDEVTFYRDELGDWRWRRVNLGNHEEVGASTEGYESFEHMVDNAYRINGEESSTLRYHKIPDE